MMNTVEGTYRNGRVELAETPQGIEEARVLVTFLDDSSRDLKSSPEPGKQGLRYGMYPGEGVTNEEDFRLAEYQEMTNESRKP